MQNIIALSSSFEAFFNADSIELSVFDFKPQDSAIFDNFSFLIKFTWLGMSKAIIDSTLFILN